MRSRLPPSLKKGISTQHNVISCTPVYMLKDTNENSVSVMCYVFKFYKKKIIPMPKRRPALTQLFIKKEFKGYNNRHGNAGKCRF